MKYDEFVIGKEFVCGGNRYLCTDIGLRTVVAIRYDKIVVWSDESVPVRRSLTHEQAISQGWYKGPPYAVTEVVFDENDQLGCCAKVTV